MTGCIVTYRCAAISMKQLPSEQQSRQSRPPLVVFKKLPNERKGNRRRNTRGWNGDGERAGTTRSISINPLPLQPSRVSVGFRGGYSLLVHRKDTSLCHAEKPKPPRSLTCSETGTLESSPTRNHILFFLNSISLHQIILRQGCVWLRDKTTAKVSQICLLETIRWMETLE